MLTLHGCSNKRNIIGIESPDSKYMLLEVNNNKKGQITFIVIDNLFQFRIIYTTPNLYSGMFYIEGFWGNKNNDFFILSSDVGYEVFRYEHDENLEDNIFDNSTWQDGYILNIYKDSSGKKYAELINIETEEAEEYDIENIPKKIIDYAQKIENN